jgi:hypothetical protein
LDGSALALGHEGDGLVHEEDAAGVPHPGGPSRIVREEGCRGEAAILQHRDDAALY